MKTHVCHHCGRINPPGARYCYDDGLALVTGMDNRPVDAGSSLFPSPLVFPSGRSCRNFDEVVLAAEEQWGDAQKLLGEGQFAQFFSSIGRADLARAANVKNTADPEHTLDDLLTRLPSSARKAPQLHVQPTEFNLGLVQRGEVRPLRLVIRNEGMGLLRGTISAAETPWIVLGEPPGVPSQMFECRETMTLQVLLLADRIRAGGNTQEGSLLINSNGGKLTIPVRVERTPRAFFDGVLAGAKSPRQLAEKARVAPKESIPYFESGAVRAWYESNGWPWPMKEGQAMGLGAVQQFFEVLGLTSPPRVEINSRFVKFFGKPGETHYHSLKLTTLENRPIYAFAKSDLSWLKIGKVNASGKVARINLEATVPDQPGESLLGRIEVVANGGQRIVVAVSMSVAGTPRAAATQPPIADDTTPPLLDSAFVVLLPPEMTPLPSRPAAANDILLFNDEPPRPAPGTHESVASTNLESHQSDVESAPSLPPWRLALFRRQLVWLGVVVLVLLGTLLHDALLPAKPKEPGDPPRPRRLTLRDTEPAVAIRWHDGPKPIRPEVMPRGTMRFGLVLPREKDPVDGARLRRLTFDDWGRTNNVCLRVDGDQVLFGEAPGAWVQQRKPRGTDPDRNRPIDGAESIWRFGTLDVTQHVEVIAGRQSLRLDTCLVRYVLENRAPEGTPALNVGLRFLLDTYIGSVDGVPFTLPGRAEPCDTLQVLDGARRVPDFIEAIERDTLEKPGTILRLDLRLGKKLEAPSRVVVGGYPNRSLQSIGIAEALNERTLWKVPEVSMREMVDRLPERVKPDSAITLYWNEKPLGPGTQRELGFSFGLGQSKSDAVGKLLASAGGRFVPGGEFTVTALVSQPKDETLTLKADGVSLLPDNPAEQRVAAVAETARRKASVVTWRLRADRLGECKVWLTSNTGATVTLPLLIHEPGTDFDLFD